MEKLISFKNRNNLSEIELIKNNTQLTKKEMKAITKIELKINDNIYSSIDYPDYFNWHPYSSKILINPGLLNIDNSKNAKLTQIIVYSVDKPYGIIWGEFKLFIK